MARRPSTVSVNSFASIQGIGRPSIHEVSSPRIVSNQNEISSRKASLSKIPNDSLTLDPDELFRKHTVTEVKLVQKRLRADADAKQEELRLMVGERYRDLLQASTSIIAIARSSKHVTEALEETKAAIISQEEPPLPKRAALNAKEDTNLQALQQLSAHMKLLLDAPEHLWRLIEKKKYYAAAWLFLLARVVHRALIRDDEQDEEAWSSQGIDVLEQFPLVTRQWDAVSQFRSQIIHKATLSLREYTPPPEDTCATLLTLHLLDSRPLTETFSVLLSQRSKTLQSLLSWTPESSHPISLVNGTAVHKTNGHPPETKITKSASGSLAKPILAVKHATQTALYTIIKTVKNARDIFQENASGHSLVGSVLEYIQTDSPSLLPHTTYLPTELQLTTQTLLTTLPSSTHFLLLPPALRSYKPYVDLTSSSSSVPQSQFIQRLDDWFHKSTNDLQTAMQRWFSDLQSVREVWNIRTSMRHWILSSPGLGDQEVDQVKSIIDHVCNQRVLAIWKATLDDAEMAFEKQLGEATSSLGEGSNTYRIDVSPVENLFQAPPLPVVSQAGLIPADTSFQKYKAALRRQLLGRTSLLDDVLATLENCARSLQQDLALVLETEGEDTHVLAEQLTEAYRPNAERLCSGVSTILESTIEKNTKDTVSDVSMDSLVFTGRIADELASSSLFISEICTGAESSSDFRKNVTSVHHRVIDRWRKHTVSRIVREHRLAIRPLSKTRLPSHSVPSGPSSGLVKSLLTLANSIQQLGLCRDPSRQENLTAEALRLFIVELLDDVSSWELDNSQALWDLTFLRQLVNTRDDDDCGQRLDEKLDSLRSQGNENNTPERKELDRVSSDYLARTQILFAALLPHPSAVLRDNTSISKEKYATLLLPYGTPSMDQKFQFAVDSAKPSSRFGLLLVGSGGGN